MRGEPGTRCRLYYDCGVPGPVEGDFIRTTAGSCYLIERARRSRTRPERVHLDVIRLDRDAVDEGQDGVWPLHWYPRRRKARA
jgi:hypothetical protein